MTLVELETKEKFDALMEMFKNENPSIESHFIGARKNRTGEWNWINGGEHSYQVELSVLNRGDEKDSCLQYSAGTSFSVVPCSDNVAQLVCQKTTSLQ
jgi:hypothetical protein